MGRPASTSNSSNHPSSAPLPLPHQPLLHRLPLPSHLPSLPIPLLSISLQRPHQLLHNSLPLSRRIQLPVPPQTLIMPIYLAAVCFSVALGVALRGLDGGACVDEEEGCHCEGGEGHCWGLWD